MSFLLRNGKKITKQFVRFQNTKDPTELKYNTHMFENPYIRKFRQKRDSVSPHFHKKTTGLTGLFVDENPHRTLKLLYTRTLKVLEKIPEDAVYRVSTEGIVKQRLALVEAEPDILKLEEKIGMGQIEEVIEQAELELQTARVMYDYEPWKPLVELPEEEQYRWPIH